MVSIWLQCMIGALAAVGFICILKAVYDIIFTGYYRAAGRSELFLYGCGSDPKTEQLLNTAEQVRRLYLPGLSIIFVENGDADPERFNYAKSIAERRDMEYIE